MFGEKILNEKGQLKYAFLSTIISVESKPVILGENRFYAERYDDGKTDENPVGFYHSCIFRKYFSAAVQYD